jgi:hypothetical protein
VRARRDVVSLKAARGLSPGFGPASAPLASAGRARPGQRPIDVRRSPSLRLTGACVVVAAIDWGVDVDSAAFRWPDGSAAENGEHQACGARKYDSACWPAFPQCRRSGGDLILVSESVEDFFPPDPVLGEVDQFWWPGAGLGRGELSEGTVWPCGVVVLQVLGHHPAQVMLIDDQQPVEEFPAEDADDPLADCVRSGRLRGWGEF